MKRKTDNFSKFYNKKNNAAIKESFRQEKKAAKRERKEAIERHFEEKRKARAGQETQAQRPIGKSAPGKPVPGKSTPAKPSPGKSAPGKPAGPVRSAPGAKPTNGPAAAAPSTGPSKPTAPSGHADQLPLNKYIAHSGVCSRRDAAGLIKEGKVTVNGQPVTEPGTKVVPTDTVKVNGKKVTISRNFVYILLNKPKDYITTTDDPQGRKTVLDLIRQATPERVFPVGRLDRNTSGVLLLTNDGDLAQKLAHPSHEIKKIYHVVLDKPLIKADFDKIIGGQIVLEDGPALVDVLAYADPKDRTQIGLEIHSGRNRIVRRIFEHLGYDVRGLDRVMYAGLTKKNVQRGKWRLLTEKEIRILKYLNSSFKGSLAPSRAAASAASAASVASAAAKGATPRSAANAEAPSRSRSANAEGSSRFKPAKAEAHSKFKLAAAEAPSKFKPAAAEAPSKRKPARSTPPKGQKKSKPVRGRKPYNANPHRPESN